MAEQSEKPGSIEGPLPGTSHTEVGGLRIDEMPAGAARVKRVIYPPGWRWRDHMPAVTGTDWCRHAHVGFLVQGAMVVRYEDGCEVSYTSPTPVVIDPGHDGWVVGDQACVLVQVDCGPDTVNRFGLRDAHAH